jgi:hypothetical protein
MTMRWIWLVPSYIWVIVDQRAVSAARWRAGRQVSARIQHGFRVALPLASW